MNALRSARMLGQKNKEDNPACNTTELSKENKEVIYLKEAELGTFPKMGGCVAECRAE